MRGPGVSTLRSVSRQPRTIASVRQDTNVALVQSPRITAFSLGLLTAPQRPIDREAANLGREAVHLR